MSKQKELGTLGEDHVVEWLIQRGYTIIDRNYRIRGGELDIIASRGGRVGFIEAKTRQEAAHIDAAQVVSAQQMHALSRCSNYWLASNPGYVNMGIHLAIALMGPDEVVTELVWFVLSE